MSVCLGSSTVLTNTVGATHASNLTEGPSVSASTLTENKDEKDEKSAVVSKNVAKIIVANSQAVTTTGCSPLPQKIVSSPLITVMNTSGPITVVKSSLGSNTTSHFTLVNSAPIYVKSPTITLLNAPPITVVKTISGTSQVIDQAKSGDVVNSAGSNNGSLAAVTEKTLHNVFVKKTPNEIDIPQSHKLLTANPFPANNMIQNSNSTPLIKTINGHRTIPGNKVKILGNVVMPNNVAGPSNVLLNKSNSQRFYQQKNVGNGTAKYLNKPVTGLSKTHMPTKSNFTEKTSQKVIYAPHKSQIKTISGVSSYSSNKPGIKTLSPQNKPIPGQVQKTGAGLRTIPPQKQHKPPSKPNYIGKHAVQAQKLKQPLPKMKQIKQVPMNSYQNRISQSNQVTFNQALTAQILETLQKDNSKVSSNYEPSRYDSINYNYSEPQRLQPESSGPCEYKPQSNLDTLSFVCQAVLLDHNYNATLPTDLPVMPNISQPNGVSNLSLYSPGNNKRQRPSLTPTNTLLSLSTSSLLPSNTSQDDDAASDISCPSDRKPESEGEETDTAPEAEAVANDDQFDRYGDCVTRCICGFIHDDGYMIECDQCKVWQHVRCVVRNKKVPDDYLCEECDPSKPTDRHKARAAQQQWMREVQERDVRLRKEQLKDTLTDSDSSDGEQPSNNNISLANKSRRKPELKQRPRRERDKRQLKRKMTKRKVKTINKSNSEDEKQQIPQLRQWIDNYEEAVTNHYSPELRARISSIRINGAHSELIGQVDPQIQKCKVQYNPSGVKYLVATMNMNPETAVIELRGKYMLSTQHRTSSHLSNLTTRQQRPGPFLFFYRLHKDNTEVCVDTRTYGNIARFIRRSCQPNAELRHCIEKGVLHLYVVTINSVDKNTELTIKHESHDLAAVGVAEIPCACGHGELCNLKTRKNGDNVFETSHRKRRGRRTSSISVENTSNASTKIKEEIEEKVDIKIELSTMKTEIKEEPEPEEETVQVEETVVKMEDNVVKPEPLEEEEEDQNKQQSEPSPVSNRRSSYNKNENEEKKEISSIEDKEKNKKLSREERKLQAIMKAIERMEKQEQRKQEHQAKQAHRRESEPTPHKEEEKLASKSKRRKRKGRTRTLSTNSQHSRRNRLNSADSIHATSSDDTLLSPNDHTIDQSSPNKAAGLLLALANGETRNELKSPERIRDIDSNSNSSPETPLSSACLLVAAAVEPLEPGFKFPKTKKGLMNEWLNKGTDVVQSASSISPSSLTAHITPTESIVYDTNTGFYTPSKNLVSLAQAATYCDSSQPRGNAKKRWLRQAISEDQCDSPNSRPESPPAAEMVAPPKKRRLPRESLPSETIQSTSNNNLVLLHNSDGDVLLDITVNQESDSLQTLESENPDFPPDLKQEYGKSLLSESQELTRKELGSLLDPRLSRDRPTSLFSSSDHLVGTVEKTLSFLGFDDKKPEQVTPAKRKLSITEYRQRKKLNNNEKNSEEGNVEESNLSQSPKPIRNRSNSSSSGSSCVTSDDEPALVETPGKVLSAFNSEPTELERQRENVSLRLKKAFGLSVDDELRKPALNVETILKCDLPTPIKSSIPLSSPTFPIPGSSEPPPSQSSIIAHSEPQQPPELTSQSEPVKQTDTHLKMEKRHTSTIQKPTEDESVMYYTPDEEELEISTGDQDKGENANYVPPFNNPLYPNSTYTNYGSVIDDDVPYEGRNPSPPPDLSGAQ